MKLEFNAKDGVLNQRSSDGWWFEAKDEKTGVEIRIWFEKLVGDVRVKLYDRK